MAAESGKGARKLARAAHFESANPHGQRRGLHILGDRSMISLLIILTMPEVVMAVDARHCIAITKAGTPCKRTAQAGSDYCAIHARSTDLTSALTPKGEAAAAPAADVVTIERDELQQLAIELNTLAEELRRFSPDFSPPPYSPQALRSLLGQVFDRLAPSERMEILANVRSTLDSVTLDDLKDVETWKGLWFTLNYLVSTEASKRKDWVMEKLSHMPGLSLASGMKDAIASTPPEEFLKPETWKGVWFVVNYELQNQASTIKRRLFGSAEQDETTS